MIAMRIGPDVRFAVVAAKSYFQKHPPPKVPHDLVGHSCINLRLPTYGGLYAWEFERDGREMRVRVDGQCVFNSILRVLEAAIDGLGVAYLPEDLARPYLANGRLTRVLEDWCPHWTGITCTTQAGGNHRLPSRCCSPHCAGKTAPDRCGLTERRPPCRSTHECTS
jgi:DNA-binding transcriptional LysR family regulator